MELFLLNLTIIIMNRKSKSDKLEIYFKKYYFFFLNYFSPLIYINDI